MLKLVNPLGCKLKVLIFSVIRKSLNLWLLLKKSGTGLEKLENFGLSLGRDGNKVIVDDVIFNSKAEKKGFDFDFEIKSVELPQEQMNKYWVLLGRVYDVVFCDNKTKSKKK